MGRFASDSGGGNFTPAPIGTHVARCIKIVDLGTQHGEYKGEPTRRSQILVTWELPDELITVDGEEVPITTSKFYTNSLGEKANLRRDFEGWRGRSFTDEELKEFDLENVLTKPCMLTVVGRDNGKTAVASVSGLPKKTVCPKQVNPSFTFWLDEYDEEKFNQISDGIKKIIEKSEEWAALKGKPVATRSAEPESSPEDDSPLNDDDIPF